MTIPALPLMLYDGDCGFCRHWIEKWRVQTGSHIRYETYQSELKNYPQLNEENCRAAVQLILPGGSVVSGAQAVFQALSLSGKPGWLRLYQNVPLFAPLAEGFYKLVAHNRMFFSKLTRAPQCARGSSDPNDKGGS